MARIMTSTERILSPPHLTMMGECTHVETAPLCISPRWRVFPRADRFKMPAPSYDSKTGVNYPNGLVTEVGTPYRYGELSLNSSWGNIGINSEYVRHKIQNEFAHGIGQPQPYFKVLDWNSHLVLNGSYTNLGFNTHSLWH